MFNFSYDFLKVLSFLHVVIFFCSFVIELFDPFSSSFEYTRAIFIGFFFREEISMPNRICV